MLTVLEVWTVKRSDNKGTRSRCYAKCSCGNVSEYDYTNVKSGNSKRCKACSLKSRSKSKSTHEMSAKSKSQGGKSYYAWQAMKRRCYNPNSARYEEYGGRGIEVCDRWLDSFESFIFDMGEPPTGEHTIERIDTDGNYEPSNCKWASKKEQANNKRNNRKITAFGKTMNLQQWAEQTGLKRECIAARIGRGWSNERALGLEGDILKYCADGHKFKSIRQCANHFGLSVSGAYGRITSEKYKDWFKL